MAMPRMAATAEATAVNGAVLDPTTVPKYQDTLPILMPVKASFCQSCGRFCKLYKISARRFDQQILPAPFGKSTVLNYVPTSTPFGQEASAPPIMTIEATVGQCTYVRWTNEQKDPASGACYPHVLDAVDQTLHWANPAGGVTGRDSDVCEDTTSPECQAAATATYKGPVPMITHLHGATAIGDESDGYAEAWYLPAGCKNTPGYAPEGTWYATFKEKFRKLYNPSNNADLRWTNGSAVFHYSNTQAPAGLWFHDHTLGMTRLNVYAGLAGLYFLRKPSLSGELPFLPWPYPGAHPFKTTSLQLRELPLFIEDKAFHQNGQLYYPVNDLSDKIPNGAYSPFWVPEFFPEDEVTGATQSCMVVNGKTWPKVAVARSNYRLRLQNAHNARTLVLSFTLLPPSSWTVTQLVSERISFYVIGNEGGFLKQPERKNQLLMGPAERYDVIFDFRRTAYRGRSIYMRNTGPEGPFGNLEYGEQDYPPVESTAQVMRFDIQDTSAVDNHFSDGSNLKTKTSIPLQPPPLKTRRFALLEVVGSGPNDSDSPLAQYLGEFPDPAAPGVPVSMEWMSNVTTNPKAGTTEDWTFINFTPDAHPIHIHATVFQVVEKRAIAVTYANDGSIAGYSVGDPL